MTTRRKLVAGNWKMNGLAESARAFDAIAAGVSGRGADQSGVDVVLCPPSTLIAGFAQRASAADLGLGGQDCHAAASGAHTGDVSAEMLADAGAGHVIIGHSERRTDHGETDAEARAKIEAAWRAGLNAILCVGETEAQRDAGQALATATRQLAESAPDGGHGGRLVVAYEPVWAIGTGRTPTTAEIGEMHAALRAALVARFGHEGRAFRLLYGGSVKAANAAEIFAIADVDGALVGGASLNEADFLPIVDAALQAVKAA